MRKTADVLFERIGSLGRITLNRPQALNALTLEMAQAMDARLAAWAEDESIGAVLVCGAERADGTAPFCAGGDIRALYGDRCNPVRPVARAFYWHEYRLDRRIFHYPKPYIALIDGVVMGGGVGVSVHGSHRVVSERVVFAMPETGIGFFPDVGGTYFLPRCPGEIGMYLALAGARLKAADTLYGGIGTHFVPSAELSGLELALAEHDLTGDAREKIDRVLARFREDCGEAPLASLRPAIDRCFAGGSLEEILAALESEESEWAKGILKTLATKSPTSLKVAFRQLGEGARLDFDEAMRLEYRIARRFAEGHDFYEGVRAVVVDKDDAPRWQPETLGKVGEAAVWAYFAPLPDGELHFD